VCFYSFVLNYIVGQAAYPAYGSFDYIHQMPQSTHQVAAYGAYHSTYTPQVPNLMVQKLQRGR
jgi:hypothetical protein